VATTGLRGRDIAAIWCIAAAIAVPLLVWMLSAMRSLDVPRSQAFLEYNTARVDDFQQATAAGARGVVLMGDSRVRYGTELQADLSSRLTTELGQDVAVLRLSYDWATFEDFEPLMPMILDAEPELILLQEELRLKNRGYDASEAIKREYLWWKLLGDDLWNPGGNEQIYYQEEMTCEAVGAQDLGVRLNRLARWVDYDEAGDSAKKVQLFIEQLGQAEIDFRYLDVPISTEARLVLPGVELTQAPLGLSPNVTFDDLNYCDEVHMDPVARAAYTDWFITAIAQELSSL